MRMPLRSSASGIGHGLRELDRRRVAGVAAGDRPVEARAVADGLRDRADLVEARREGDDAVARDRAVGRAQADEAAERRGLLDRPARVGAEAPRGEPACDRGGGAAGRAAGHALGIPGVLRRAVGRVLRGRAHGELVQIGLADERQPGLLDPRRDGGVEDGDVALEDAGAGRGRDAARRDVVLERDRDAVSGLADDVQVGVELGVALADRLDVGTGELVAGDLAGLEEPGGLFRGETKGVDHGAIPRGHPTPPPAFTLTRKSAPVAREKPKNRRDVTTRPPGHGTPRPPGPAHWPEHPPARERAATRPPATR